MAQLTYEEQVVLRLALSRLEAHYEAQRETTGSQHEREHCDARLAALDRLRNALAAAGVIPA